MKRWTAFTCMLFAMVLAAAPANAQDPDPVLPPPDPPNQWRKLTWDDTTSTSQCIGNPVTPLCAAETFWACFLRRRPEYCDMVEAGVRPLPNVTNPADKREEYRVVYARRPSRLDPIEPTSEGRPKNLQTGDVLLALMKRVCYGAVDDDSDCQINGENDPPYIMILRKRGDFWITAYRFRPRF